MMMNKRVAMDNLIDYTLSPMLGTLAGLAEAMTLDNINISPKLHTALTSAYKAVLRAQVCAIKERVK
jgi:hypothetical protein